jgi:hypothetical protein
MEKRITIVISGPDEDGEYMSLVKDDQGEILDEKYDEKVENVYPDIEDVILWVIDEGKY